MPKTKIRPTVIAGSNVDVEALFGAQATKKTVKINGNRLEPRPQGLTHGDSFAPSVKNGELSRGLSPAMIAEHELERMRKAELEQSETDGFWGLDKEHSDKCVELRNMCIEDGISAENERLWSISTLQRQWEAEEQKCSEDARLNATIDEEHARLAYMEAFYTSQSSGGVLQYPWPTRPTVTTQQPAETDQENSTNKGGPDYKYKEGYDILCSDFGNISTIHVNGLQRGQEVSVGGQKAEGNEAKAVASLAMRPPGTRKVPPNNSSSTRNNNANRNVTANSSSPRQGNVTPPSPTKEQQLSFDSHDQRDWQVVSKRQGRAPNLLDLAPRYVKDSNSLMTGGGSKHNALYDGHPLYRWDQEQMLRVVFNLLDDTNQGSIGRAQISEMARSAEIQGILKYTVFWLPLKRRQWSFFYNIFDDEAETITVEEWVNAAYGLANCEEVNITQVRMDDEQKEVAAACSVTGDWSEHRFAAETRAQLHKHARAALTLRKVAPKDLVWVLYSKGCRWLPARVVMVHNSEGHSLLDSTFTVRYIMSTEDFKKAQTDTETREFLPKPRPVKKKSSNGEERKQPLVVKPFNREEEVCAYVFDSIDEDRCGVLDPEVLTEALKSKPFAQVVYCSSTLSLLVKGGGDGPLLGLLAELFPGGDDGPGVTKGEFVEFCTLIESMNLFDDYFHAESKEVEPEKEEEPLPPVVKPVEDDHREDDMFVTPQY